MNHGWHSTLYVTARGLTTSPIPHGLRMFQIDFDFIDHALIVARQRRPDRACRARAADRRDVLSARDGRAARPRSRRAHPRQPERGGRSDSLRSRRGASRLRRRGRQPLLARARAERPRVQAVPLGIHRQVQSGAPLLGRARSGGHALLRADRTGAPGRHSPPAGSGHARGLLARGQQLRVLGWRRGDRLSRRTTPTRIRSRPVSRTRESRRRRRSTAPTCASSSCPTMWSGHRTIPIARCSSSCSRPTSPPRTSRSGIAPRSNRRSAEPRRPPLRARAPGCATRARAMLAIDRRTLRSTSSRPRGSDHPSPMPMP